MIDLIAIGTVDQDILDALKESLAEVFAQRTHVGDSVALPGESWNQQRGQHLAPLLLANVPSPPSPGHRVLAVIDVDICAPGLNFAFGQAEISGKRALISLARLRQEFYRLPRDESLFRERTLKEAVHELGHTYGLGHCPNPTCVMHFSNSLHDTDLRDWNFCPRCRAKVSREV